MKYLKCDRCDKIYIWANHLKSSLLCGNFDEVKVVGNKLIACGGELMEITQAQADEFVEANYR
jgi:hypothetical protein